MSKVESGWYFASHFVKELDDTVVHPKKKARIELSSPEVTLYAWCTPSVEFPDRLHVPFWARKPAQGLRCRPLTERLLDAQSQLVAENEALKDQNQKLTEEIEAIRADKRGDADRDRERDYSHRSWDEKHREKKPGGGWMNKCIQIMVPLFDGENGEACTLATEMLATNSTAYLLVAKTVCQTNNNKLSSLCIQ